MRYKYYWITTVQDGYTLAYSNGDFHEMNDYYAVTSPRDCPEKAWDDLIKILEDTVKDVKQDLKSIEGKLNLAKAKKNMDSKNKEL